MEKSDCLWELLRGQISEKNFIELMCLVLVGHFVKVTVCDPTSALGETTYSVKMRNQRLMEYLFKQRNYIIGIYKRVKSDHGSDKESSSERSPHSTPPSVGSCTEARVRSVNPNAWSQDTLPPSHPTHEGDYTSPPLMYQPREHTSYERGKGDWYGKGDLRGKGGGKGGSKAPTFYSHPSRSQYQDECDRDRYGREICTPAFPTSKPCGLCMNPVDRHPWKQCRSNNVCHNCGSWDHKTADCPHLTGPCFNCDDEYHLTHKCRVRCKICGGPHPNIVCYGAKKNKDRWPACEAQTLTFTPYMPRAQDLVGYRTGSGHIVTQRTPNVYEHDSDPPDSSVDIEDCRSCMSESTQHEPADSGDEKSSESCDDRPEATGITKRPPPALKPDGLTTVSPASQGSGSDVKDEVPVSVPADVMEMYEKFKRIQMSASPDEAESGDAKS